MTAKRFFQMTQDEFIQHQVNSKITNYEGGIKLQREKIKKLGPGATTSRQKEEYVLKMWQKQVDDFKSGKWAEINHNWLSEQYAKAVKKAISTGEPVPQDIVDSSPEFKTARNARERYEKGRHTSFANRSVAINESMRANRGYKVKRQDGKPITPEQVEEIELGVGQIESVLGSLQDIFDKTDITIAHTSGKHPFLSGSAGCYSAKERTVSTGTGDVHALAHEVGHWLDFESGSAEHLEAPIMVGEKRRMITSAAEATRYDYKSSNPLAKLITSAQISMSDTYEARKLFKRDTLVRATGERKEEMEKIKFHLGNYWQSPREIFARLVEQYVATKLGTDNAATDPAGYYQKAPAYWSKGYFASIMPRIEDILKQRVSVLRGTKLIADEKPKITDWDNMLTPALNALAAKGVPEAIMEQGKRAEAIRRVDQMVKDDENSGYNSPEAIEQRNAEQMINRANMAYAKGTITKAQYDAIVDTYKPKISIGEPVTVLEDKKKIGQGAHKASYSDKSPIKKPMGLSGIQ